MIKFSPARRGRKGCGARGLLVPAGLMGRSVNGPPVCRSAPAPESPFHSGRCCDLDPILDRIAMETLIRFACEDDSYALKIGNERVFGAGPGSRWDGLGALKPTCPSAFFEKLGLMSRERRETEMAMQLMFKLFIIS